MVHVDDGARAARLPRTTPGPVPLGTPAAAPGPGADGLLRRSLDVVVALLGLLLLAPLLGLLALAVRLDSPGPALFRQVRVGRDGRPFRILKFRSMVAAQGPSVSQVSGREDPRVTRVGRLLRVTKLDELPQLWNVLRGEMTLVGPRAEVPDYVRHYTSEERLLLGVRPGLTGAGQLYFTTDQAGDLDAAADPERHYLEHQLHPKLAIDLAYLRQRGPVTDLRLLARTVGCLLGVR